MAKVSGAYARVTGGVSEQVAQDRGPGQHAEQINMISDPVRGLARRHGSRLQHEQKLYAMTASDYNNILLPDTEKHKVFPFFVDGVEFDLIYRTTPPVSAEVDQCFMWAFNKVTRKFIEVVSGVHENIEALKAGGVSSLVNVGKYLFIAGKTIVPTYIGVDEWVAPANQQKLAVWFRGGAYSKTYKVTLTKTDNTKVSKEYKTLSSSYQVELDTSDISATDPSYQKLVNDRVYAWQSAMNAYIGEAAEDITPTNIANKLQALFDADGVTCSVVDGTLVFDDPDFKEVQAEDGGDGTLVRAVGAEVPNTDMLSSIHWAGKIVKVRPKKNDGTDALYLQAIAKDGSAGWTDVSWKEVAGYVMQPSCPFAIATVRPDGKLYVGGDPTELSTISGDATPGFKANEVGDEITSPPPYFMNKKIDYLGLFQDRLAVGSGAVVFFSRPGDYFNWWRTSVLSLDDRDPVEQYALGSEDDTIVSSTTYDKNLVLFGRRNQYAINGRAPVSLKNPIYVLSSFEDAVDANPVNSGNFVFYGTGRNDVTSAHQIQVGTLADSPESFEITQQLDRYIKGNPVEILAVTSPNVIFLRTTAVREQVFVYGYLDTPEGAQRLFDSWSRWTWDKRVGQIVGIGRDSGDILIYTIKHGKDLEGEASVWLSAEAFTLASGISKYPYLDSLRPTPSVTEPDEDSFIHDGIEEPSGIYLGFGMDKGDLAFLGTNIENLNTFAEQYPTTEDDSWTGIDYEAFVTPTNPYMRDKDGKAIVNGRLTLTKVVVSVADTGGFRAFIKTANGVTKTQDYSGRTLGRISNRVGIQPIVTGSVSVLIGKETRECSYSMYAKPLLPFTVTAIEWTGQYLNNTRRV